MKDFKLDNHPKINPGFKAPEGYFDDFPEKILTEINKEPKVISIFARRKTWIYAAAAILVASLSIPFYFNLNKSANDLDTASIENYISYQSDVSQYDLVNLLDSKDIDNMNVDLKIEDKTIEDVLTNSSNLENYLTD